jgi:hypothetical protein
MRKNKEPTHLKQMVTILTRSYKAKKKKEKERLITYLNRKK